MITLGILADTHIPDRVKRLHPQVIPTFSQAKVSAILHAGDISVSGVLRELRQIAEVYAVRGNRDWLLPHLPKTQNLIFNGTTITLTHGHGNLRNYLSGHLQNIMTGSNDLTEYHHRLQNTFPKAKVIVYGHLHLPVNKWQAGQLLFNPGSPHFPAKNCPAPTIGLLEIDETGEIDGKIISLKD